MLLRRRSMLALPAAVMAAAVARAQQAAPAEVAAEWPQARQLGGGRLRFLGLRVYDARLWAPGPLGADDWAARPFALELVYARSLQGASIASRSLAEMRRQGPFDDRTSARWLAAMTAAFPDVKDGDRLTGLHRPGGRTLLPQRRAAGEWRDTVFARQFFGIWLSPQTSEPRLARGLARWPLLSSPAVRRR
jgi:hypothetical protein